MVRPSFRRLRPIANLVEAEDINTFAFVSYDNPQAVGDVLEAGVSKILSFISSIP